MAVFNPWNWRRDELARRVNSIERKLYGAMLLVEAADNYPRSKTANMLEGVREMRVLDLHIDAAQAQLHGALDMLASALSLRHGLSDKRRRPMSFAQMFDANDALDARVADAVGAAAVPSLTALYRDAKDMIDQDNGSKHREMEDVYLLPEDYPDYLKELSAALMPEMREGREVRDWSATVRTLTDGLGRQICALVPVLFA